MKREEMVWFRIHWVWSIRLLSFRTWCGIYFVFNGFPLSREWQLHNSFANFAKTSASSAWTFL